MLDGMNRISLARAAGLCVMSAAGAVFVLSAALPGTPPASAEEPPPRLKNASFEEGGAPPAGWEMFEGATNGPSGDSSEVSLDATIVKHGKSSLRLSGGAGTTAWQLVRQKAAVEPGQRVTLRMLAKSVAVRKEGNQYPNANGILEFVNAKNERVQMLWTPTLIGDHEWTELRLTTIVPAATASAWVGVFLSQSGTLWFDDVRLDVAPASLADPAGRAAALDALKAHLVATYPYFGVNRRPTAEMLFGAAQPRFDAAKDEETFVVAMRQMLANLEDLHVWIKRAGKAIPTAPGKSVRPNLDPKTRSAALTSVVEGTAPFVVGRIGEGAAAVGYVEIPTWQMDDATVARLEGHLDSLSDCRALILDVRANQGGDETIAARIASRFCAEDIVYARTSVREPWKPEDTAAMTPPADRVLAARKGAKPDTRKVAVLQGPVCMSSCEGFLLMCRALPGVTTVGDRSRGSSGNPKAFVVVPDVVVHASTWQTFAPDGTPVDGKGVVPEVPSTEPVSKVGDVVLGRALSLLSE